MDIAERLRFVEPATDRGDHLKIELRALQEAGGESGDGGGGGGGGGGCGGGGGDGSGGGGGGSGGGVSGGGGGGKVIAHPLEEGPGGGGGRVIAHPLEKGPGDASSSGNRRGSEVKAAAGMETGMVVGVEVVGGVGSRPPDSAIGGTNEAGGSGKGKGRSNGAENGNDNGNGSGNGNGDRSGDGDRIANANDNASANGVSVDVVSVDGTSGGISTATPEGFAAKTAAAADGNPDADPTRQDQPRNRRRLSRKGDGGVEQGRNGGGGGRRGVARGFLPVCRATDPICPIVRIPPDEGHVFKTKQRAPTLITCEIIVPQREREEEEEGRGGGGDGGWAGVPRGASSPTLIRRTPLPSRPRPVTTPTGQESSAVADMTVVASPKTAVAGGGGGGGDGSGGSGDIGGGSGGVGERAEGRAGETEEGGGDRRGSGSFHRSNSMPSRASSAPARVGSGVGGVWSREGGAGAGATAQGAGALAASPLRHRRKVSHGSDREEVEGIIGTQVSRGRKGGYSGPRGGSVGFLQRKGMRWGAEDGGWGAGVAGTRLREQVGFVGEGENAKTQDDSKNILRHVEGYTATSAILSLSAALSRTPF